MKHVFATKEHLVRVCRSRRGFARAAVPEGDAGETELFTSRSCDSKRKGGLPNTTASTHSKRNNAQGAGATCQSSAALQGWPQARDDPCAQPRTSGNHPASSARRRRGARSEAVERWQISTKLMWPSPSAGNV